jgi:PIN domain nuclease of toxin-antitoxin system
MKLLLDTHIFLWYISGDARLDAGLQAQIQDPANEVFLSVASVWEAVIKYDFGKLPLPRRPEEYLPQHRDSHGIVGLPIEEGAMSQLASLPPLHRDPFDRVMIAQSLQYDMTLVTLDAAVRSYPVKLLP